MASHNYWIWSSTLISTFSSFMLLIVSLNDFYNKGRDLTNELKKRYNSGFPFLHPERSGFIFKNSKPRKELHVLLWFEVPIPILSPHEYLNNSCALLFWNAKCLCVRGLKFMAFWQQKGKSIFKAWERRHIILHSYTVLSVSWRILQGTWAERTFTTVSKHVLLFVPRLHQRATQGQLEKINFISLKIVSTIQHCSVNTLSSCKNTEASVASKEWGLQCAERKVSPNPKFLKEFLPAVSFPSMCIFLMRRKFNL